ncbi:MAG: potassium channel family protein [Candidatus Izemoplasmataceae bacterium]
MENNDLIKQINKVLIIGCGRFGAALALMLSEKDKEVTVIDKDEQAFRKLSKAYGGNVYYGDGLLLNVLIDQQIKQCDLVVCSTEDDNTNIFISLIASKLYKIPLVYSRLYDSDRGEILEKSNVRVICPAELSVTAFKNSFNPVEVTK